VERDAAAGEGLAEVGSGADEGAAELSLGADEGAVELGSGEDEGAAVPAARESIAWLGGGRGAAVTDVGSSTFFDLQQ
jgi:hypothetical protein